MDRIIEYSILYACDRIKNNDFDGNMYKFVGKGVCDILSKHFSRRDVNELIEKLSTDRGFKTEFRSNLDNIIQIANPSFEKFECMLLTDSIIHFILSMNKNE